MLLHSLPGGSFYYYSKTNYFCQEKQKIIHKFKKLVTYSVYNCHIMRYNISRVTKMDKKCCEEKLKNIGDNLYSIRKKEMHKTQEEFAEMVGVSKDTISKIERGTVCPSLQNMAAIATVTNRTIDFFMNERFTEKNE